MIHLDYDAVMSLGGVAKLVAPLRPAFAAVTLTPARHHHELDAEGRRTLLLMPAWRGANALGVKISTVFNDNPSQGFPAITGLYLLLSAQNGSVSATIDGRALTLLRTAAVSALAAELLAPSDAGSLLMVGTGALAPFLIEAHASVRPYRRIEVWGRDLTKAHEVTRKLKSAGIEAHAVEDLESAVRSADVISCATNATEALIRGAWLKERVHLDLVGSYKPGMREADEDCLRGAAIVVDTLDALRESGDLLGPIKSKTVDADQVDTLGAALIKAEFRASARTVFKSVGTALADLAAAEYLCAEYSRSRAVRPKDRRRMVSQGL
jgi:alanine dehydrogenase